MHVLGATTPNDIPFCIGSERSFRRIENDESILPRVLDHRAQTDANLKWPCNHLPARFNKSADCSWNRSDQKIGLHEPVVRV